MVAVSGKTWQRPVLPGVPVKVTRERIVSQVSREVMHQEVCNISAEFLPKMHELVRTGRITTWTQVEDHAIQNGKACSL